jgi:hypothetical protein
MLKKKSKKGDIAESAEYQGGALSWRVWPPYVVGVQPFVWGRTS